MMKCRHFALFAPSAICLAAAAAPIHFDPPDIVLWAAGEDDIATAEIDLDNDGRMDLTFVAAGDLPGYPNDVFDDHVEVAGTGVTCAPWAETNWWRVDVMGAATMVYPHRAGEIVYHQTPIGPDGQHAFIEDAYDPWPDMGGRYVGVRMEIDGRIHSGWVHVASLNDQSNFSAILIVTDWAFEAVPETDLVIGDTGCPADRNGDGAADFFDLQDFLNDFNSRHFTADLDQDGLFTFSDASRYLDIFAAGCP